MEVRESLERRIESKRKEVTELELKIREQLAYIRALEDTLRLLNGDDDDSESVRAIRADSDVGKSREALKKAANPLHISDLVRAIGKSDDKRNRTSLAGTLASYARRNHVFTRPGPNTFGLIELSAAGSPTSTESQPPDDFGQGITDDDVPF